MRKNVLQYLIRTVKTFPKKTAVIDNKQSVSFEELLASATCLAEAISRYSLRNRPIGVYLPKSCQMVQSFAGINLSGNFYVPLDTKSPISRVLSILSVLESDILVTNSEYAEKLQGHYYGKIVLIDDIPLKVFDHETIVQNYLSPQIDTDPVYAIFTSGSTGIPKGVVISHRGVIDYIDWAIETFHITDDTVIGNQAPFYFDNSTLDIYLMYSTGATLNIIPETCFSFPAKLVDYLNDNKITFVFWVPFVLINIANFDIFKDKIPSFLKDVFFAGEVMPNRHLNYWRKHLPNCRYVNLYGPTEITVDCTYYIVDRPFEDSEPLPIGYPCNNSDVLILVNREREASINEQGELCVRGSSLALGYYNDWGKTRLSFIQNPLNTHYPEFIYCTGDIAYRNEKGEIIFVGRKDSQIKHNGYRIELGEIENAFLSDDCIENCCAIYDFTEKRIVLFYQSSQAVDLPALKRTMMSRIPRYMIPSVFREESVMIQNSNGKIDRAYYQKLVNAKD